MDQEETLLHTLDEELLVLTKNINLQKYLMPTNLVTEREKFLAMKGTYDPQFMYAFPAEQEMQGRLQELQDMKHKYFELEIYTHPIAQLLKEKIEENIIKAQLLLAYSKQDFANIKKYNTLLFWDFDPELMKKSEAIIQSYHEPKPETRWRMLNNEEIQQYILQYMKDNTITDIQLNPIEQSTAKFMLFMWKDRCRLVFSDHLHLREYELMGDLIHEFGVHYTRYLAGKKSGRKILMHGTAGYLLDEEWLAIRSVCQYKKNIFPDFQKINIYKKYLTLATSDSKSFSQITQELMQKQRVKNLSHAFIMTTRIKEGIQDTGVKESWTSFLHNKLYAEGYEKISTWTWLHDISTLLSAGKIKAEDLPKITW